MAQRDIVRNGGIVISSEVDLARRGVSCSSDSCSKHSGSKYSGSIRMLQLVICDVVISGLQLRIIQLALCTAVALSWDRSLRAVVDLHMLKRARLKCVAHNSNVMLD